MEKNENIQMKRILDILKGHGIILAIVLTIVFMIIGYIYSYYYVTPKYKSTATLLLIPNNSQETQGLTSTDLTLNSELILTYSNIAKQSKVLKQVIQNLGLEMTEKDLLSKLQVNTTTDTYIIEIAISDTNPQRAMDITKELSNVFLQEIKELYNLENIGVVDEAGLPNAPYNVNHVKDIMLFAIIGLFVSGIVVVAIYLLDDTIKTEEEVKQYIGLKTLGKIPMTQDKKEIIRKGNAKSYITECINTMRTNILYMNSAKMAKTILITSCNAQEGKSFISANIATSFAETNKKVLIIDADMRKGRSDKIFKVPNEDGLSNYLYFMTENSRENLMLAKIYIKETQVENLHILTKGSIPPNPSELLNSENMKSLIELLKKVYDVIIIDSPPCQLVTDSVILSTIVDSVILVVNSGKTKIREILETKKSIKMVGGNLIGIVLNKIKTKGKTYSKSYYYGHADQKDEAQNIQKESYSVEELIDMKASELDIIGYETLPQIEVEEQKEDVYTQEEVEVTPYHAEVMGKFMTAQKKYFEKMAKAISEMKVQLNKSEKNNKEKDILSKDEYREGIETLSQEIRGINYQDKFDRLSDEIKGINYQDKFDRLSDEIKGINYQDKFDRLSDEIKGINYQDKFDRLSDEIKGINYQDKFDTLSEEIRNMNYKEDLNKLSEEKLTKEQIENIIRQTTLNKEDIENIIKQEILSKQDIEEIVKQEALRKQDIENILKQEVLSKQDIENIVKQQALSKQDIENIVRQQALSKQDIEEIVKQEALRKQDIENILKQEVLSKQDIENIVKQQALSKKDIESIVKQQALSKQAIENIVKQKSLSKQDIEKIIKQEAISKKDIESIVKQQALTKEEIKEIIRMQSLKEETVADIIKQEMLKMDYTKQFAQIESMMTQLKDGYLELSNKLNMEQQNAELYEENPEKVVSLDKFKKERTTKRRVYSVNEEIPYTELEKTACYVIPLKNNSSQTYTGKVASK